uniref:SnoaL-like domain-containing protein n=1 Tax=Entomoneis paludosa TaxID=265537 RepID=A0A7S2YCX1_9STRA|mmetsp:Transcript_27867/g.58350  ORF Transcript_27867/g.58350 Transcript_27867/m.58350 type:complete len:242 (+) Transcript_27867:175-900(+)
MPAPRLMQSCLPLLWQGRSSNRRNGMTPQQQGGGVEPLTSVWHAYLAALGTQHVDALVELYAPEAVMGLEELDLFTEYRGPTGIATVYQQILPLDNMTDWEILELQQLETEQEKHSVFGKRKSHWWVPLASCQGRMKQLFQRNRRRRTRMDPEEPSTVWKRNTSSALPIDTDDDDSSTDQPLVGLSSSPQSRPIVMVRWTWTCPSSGWALVQNTVTLQQECWNQSSNDWKIVQHDMCLERM